MTNDKIEAIALASGFKLKQQPDGTLALNPCVFEFAREVAFFAASELESERSANEQLTNDIARHGLMLDELKAHNEQLMAAAHDALYMLENPHLPAHEKRVIERLRQVMETKP